MEQQHVDAQAKKRNSRLVAVLSVAANFIGVATFIFSSDLTLIVRITAFAGAVLGLSLLIKQWGKPVGIRVLLAIFCITVGCAVIAASVAAAGGGKSAFQFRLEPYQGIDLDSNKHEVVDADGPNGDVDIFLDKSSYLMANNGSFYTDTEGPDSEIYNRCTKALTAQREPEDKILPHQNMRMCFKTSAGKTGWLRVNDAAIYGNIYAVLNVQIW